jgi:putative endonuclease
MDNYFREECNGYPGSYIFDPILILMYYVYILTNKPNGVLYTGMTNDIARRYLEHKNKVVKGFTAKYNLDKIVFIQEFDTHQEAFQEERRIKRWRRQWKIELIEKKNPQWKDLGVDWE